MGYLTCHSYLHIGDWTFIHCTELSASRWLFKYVYYMYGNSFVPGDLSVVENSPLLGVSVSGDSTVDVQILT